ncbi:hypothetical protein JCGZ_25486 [Jatropha curcas]|uniref:Prolamin-like domain-containing protein n=1 Tax=Jatropha curcas TaxID=180498 RepID=A0A067JLJ8_JATCU|nr:uncharacterized protein LOC119369900 [Jatropha curcas]KDP24737.1 hypothetical protein JCGZ_25486 [Jatropha curcas]
MAMTTFSAQVLVIGLIFSCLSVSIPYGLAQSPLLPVPNISTCFASLASVQGCFTSISQVTTNPNQGNLIGKPCCKLINEANPNCFSMLFPQSSGFLLTLKGICALVGTLAPAPLP